MDNKELFTYIWNNYNKRICYFISQIIPGTHIDFDDIYQEIMTKIYKNISNYNDDYSLDTWLYTISRNYCIDYIKKRENTEKYIQDDLHSKTENDPLHIILQQELHERIDRVLQNFSSTERQLAFLVFFEKMKYHEIRSITGLNINTIKTKIKKIRKHLKHELKDHL